MKNTKIIKGITFYLNDYTAKLEDFDFAEEVDDILEENGIDIDDNAYYGIDVIFTNGKAYCDIPHYGRITWYCKTDEEWMKNCNPKKFDIYDDMEECGINRWQIFYATQTGKKKIELYK